MDPRVRMKGLEKLLTIYYSALFPDGGGPCINIIITDVTKSLKEIYTEYKIHYGNMDETYNTRSTGTSTSASTSSSYSFSQSSDIFKDLYDVYDAHSQKRSRSTSNPYLELDAYLTSHFEYDVQEFEAFDILRWWSRRTPTFPIVARIAREVLACPVSTVAVEQAFSMGGLVLDDRRSRLTVEHLENQCLMDDWVRAANRAQHQPTVGTDSSDEIDYDNDTNE